MIFGLIGGRNIDKYSIADILWDKIFEILKLNYEFKIIPINSISDLQTFYQNFCDDSNFAGFNVALPWKGDILRVIGINEISVNHIESVNTVYKKNGQIYYANTDIIGIEKPLSMITNLDAKKILVLGAGGAGLPTALHLSQKYKCNVYIYDIADKKINTNLITVLRNNEEISKHIYDIIINATPIGKYSLLNKPTGFCLPLDIDLFLKITHSQSIVQEMNYFPYNTQLIKLAKSIGISTVSGIEMLVYQAVESFRIYTNYEFNKNQIEELMGYIRNYCIDKENELSR